MVEDDTGQVEPEEDAGETEDLGARDAGARDTGVRDTGVRDTGVRDVPPVNNCPTVPQVMVTAGAVPAFPGAEGFGAVATGGRGGAVCVVSNLSASGAGSLQACLDRTGPKYIVFRTSGVITGPLYIRQGDATLAGQTSPGGIVIRGGVLCDNVYDPYNCRNMVFRHMRFRGGADALRLSGTDRVVVDHCSFANAGDENIEISRSQNVTVQYSVVAEPVGDHFRYGGILINYSKDRFPLDRLSIHHTVWNGCYGRLPEISCEENGDGPGTSNCSGRRLQAEVSYNLMFDVSDPVYYNRCTGVNEGNDCGASARNFLLGLNFVGNVMHRRAALADQPMFVNELSRNTANQVFWQNDVFVTRGAMSPARLSLPSQSARLGHPAVTATAPEQLLPLLQAQAGAFPRDPMDTRLAGYLSQPVDSRPAAWNSSVGISRGDAFTLRSNPPAAPADSDNDGMPDAWEMARGLRPDCPNANAVTLSSRPNNGIAGCTAGYTDLECYLNALSAERIAANQ